MMSFMIIYIFQTNINITNYKGLKEFPYDFTNIYKLVFLQNMLIQHVLKNNSVAKAANYTFNFTFLK